MQTKFNVFTKSSIGLLAGLATQPAFAVNLNYESLSSFEEPIAFEVADTTISLTGLVDAAYRDTDEAGSDSLIVGNFQIGAETQLANSWTLGATYFGSYSDEDSDEDDYQDNVAVYLGGIWGTAAIGNVTGLVREQTRRARGVGNGFLAFDDQLGELADYGISYVGRFGPNQFVLSADEDGGYEIGGTYQRPLGNKDYRFSLRYRDSEFTSSDNAMVFDSRAIGFVSELTYGSTVLDMGLGLEQLSSTSMDVDRAYISLGASRKFGAWSASIEAHLGDIEGESERSYSLGLRYDIARGISLNLGLNHSDALVSLDGITLLDESDTVGLASLRYSF